LLDAERDDLDEAMVQWFRDERAVVARQCRPARCCFLVLAGSSGGSTRATPAALICSTRLGPCLMTRPSAKDLQWLKTLRLEGTRSVVFATHILADSDRSVIAPGAILLRWGVGLWVGGGGGGGGDTRPRVPSKEFTLNPISYPLYERLVPQLSGRFTDPPPRSNLYYYSNLRSAIGSSALALELTLPSRLGVTSPTTCKRSWRPFKGDPIKRGFAPALAA